MNQDPKSRAAQESCRCGLDKDLRVHICLLYAGQQFRFTGAELTARLGLDELTGRTAWTGRIRELRLAGRTLDEARAIAGPMPHGGEPASPGVLPAPCPECGGGYMQDYAHGPQLIPHEGTCETWYAILDELAGRITYGVLLAAFAEFGFTGTAWAAAFAAVALSDAFENEDDGSHPGRPVRTGDLS